jgi:hypothetical protein
MWCKDTLEKTINLTSLGIYIDIEVAGSGGQSRNSLNICGKRISGTELGLGSRKRKKKGKKNTHR